MLNSLSPDALSFNMGSEKAESAEKMLQSNSFNTEAWNILVLEAKPLSIDKVRQFYEHLLCHFPTAGKYWQVYIAHEMKDRSFDKVEKLFQRCLVKVLNIDLWKMYLTYIKDTKGTLPSFREKMAQAYDFALEKVGIDVGAASIWMDYINFLKNVEAVGSYAENQRITAVRRVYQRGVVTPMLNVEGVWKSYMEYENSVNPTIAKKMLDDRGRHYVTAKRVAKEFEAHSKGIQKNNPAIPPTGSSEELRQIELWKKLISWEKSNPINSEDKAMCTKRVIYAYEQCLLCLAHHPDIWLDATRYLDDMSKVVSETGDGNLAKQLSDEAGSTFERAINSYMKDVALVYFAYADFEETKMRYDKAHEIYKKLLKLKSDPTLVYVQYMRFARRAEGIPAARTVFKMAREDSRSKFHVYIAAALMEFYCGKDKTVAFKIFDLGLKKFETNPVYVTAFLDFMSHVNEDNNTRVLFERLLSSKEIGEGHKKEIWNRFLQSEMQVGDLSSVMKTEKRRTDAICTKISKAVNKEVAGAIDRYRFMDLLPCSEEQLTAIGYQMFAAVGGKQSMMNGISSNYVNETGYAHDAVIPDVSQMLPFKPRQYDVEPVVTVLGGRFNVPPALSHLLKLLPPPDCFNGPFVSVEQMVTNTKTATVPDKFLDFKIEPSSPEKQMDVNQLLLALRKRKLVGDEDGDLAPPSHDIYRSRLEKRAK